MATVTATGIFKQLDALATLISYSSTWQELCSETTSTGALRHVHVQWLDNSDSEDMVQYPQAIIAWTDGDRFGRIKEGIQYWVTSGSMSMAFELQVPSEYSRRSANANYWFMNQVGAIIHEMEELAGQGEPVSGETHLNVTAFNVSESPFTLEEDEIDLQDPDNYEQIHVMVVVFSVEYI